MVSLKLAAIVGVAAIVVTGAVIVVTPLGREGDEIPFAPCDDDCGLSLFDQIVLLAPDDETALLAMRFRDAVEGRDGTVNIFADIDGNGRYEGEEERIVTDEPVRLAPGGVYVFRGKPQRSRKRDFALTFVFAPGRLQKPDPKQSKPPNTSVTNIIIRTDQPLPLTGAWPWEQESSATATPTTPAAAATPAGGLVPIAPPKTCIDRNGAQIPCAPESNEDRATATTTARATAQAPATAQAAAATPAVLPAAPSSFSDPFGFELLREFLGIDPYELFGPAEPPREAKELPESVLEYLEERIVPS